MSREAPRWWPPKVGSKLRRIDAATARVAPRGALLHVVSVFKDKNGEQRIVTAEWRTTRWNYEVFWWYQAAIGMLWPDGTRKPAVS